MSHTSEQEKTVVSYLLGQLPDNIQQEVEQRFFRDEAYHDYIRAVEDDLIDDYARDELDPNTRTQFERRYLNSTDRHQRLVFARAFVSVLDENSEESLAYIKPEIKQTPWWATILAPFRIQGFAFQSAVAVLLFGLLAAGVWMFVETRRLRARVAQTTEGVHQDEKLRQQLVDEQRRRSELEKQVQQLGEQNSDETKRLRDQLAQSDEKVARTQDELNRLRQSGGGREQARLAAPSFASFVLLPGARDNSGPANLIVPSAARSLNLQLQINQGDNYSSYRVDVSGAALAPVWSKSGLRARSKGSGRAVSINLPVKLLQENTSYELTLTGASSPSAAEVLGYYFFKLVKK